MTARPLKSIDMEMVSLTTDREQSLHSGGAPADNYLEVTGAKATLDGAPAVFSGEKDIKQPMKPDGGKEALPNRCCYLFFCMCCCCRCCPSICKRRRKSCCCFGLLVGIGVLIALFWFVVLGILLQPQPDNTNFNLNCNNYNGSTSDSGIAPEFQHPYTAVELASETIDRCKIQSQYVNFTYAIKMPQQAQANASCVSSGLLCIEECCSDVRATEPCADFNCPSLQHTGEVVFSATGVQSRGGTFKLGLAATRSAWNRGEIDWGRALYKNSTTVPQGCNGCTVEMTIRNVPWGVYAAVIHHDYDSDNNLDTTWYGKPEEGISASNGASGSWRGGPTWGDASFLLIGRETQMHSMWYP